MESHSIIFCLNCKDKFTEVYMLPCMHNFCSKCTNLMKNKAETTCLICSNSCHKDEVKRNTFLEKICLIDSQIKKREFEKIICEICDSDNTENEADKYCVDCLQYICEKCLKIHFKLKISKDHKIVDKEVVKNQTFKSPEPYCEKHEAQFTIYCKTCDSIMCSTCCIIDKLHSNHDKSDNLKEVFDKSNSVIKDKIIMIDDLIKDQKKLIEKNENLKTNFFQNCDKTRIEIEKYAKELKDQIDNLTKANVDKIITFKNNFIKSVQVKFEEITDYILSLTNLKSYFEKIINKGSNVDVFNSKKELNKNTWIKRKKPKLISKINISFQKPSIEKIILNKISESLKIEEVKMRDPFREMAVPNYSLVSLSSDDEETKWLNRVRDPFQEMAIPNYSLVSLSSDDEETKWLYQNKVLEDCSPSSNNKVTNEMAHVLSLIENSQKNKPANHYFFDD